MKSKRNKRVETAGQLGKSPYYLVVDRRKQQRWQAILVLGSLLIAILIFAMLQNILWRMRDLERTADSNTLRVDAMEQKHFIPGAEGVTRAELDRISEMLARVEMVLKRMELQQAINTSDIRDKVSK